MTKITLPAATIPAPRKVLGDNAVIHLVNTQHIDSVTFSSVERAKSLLSESLCSGGGRQRKPINKAMYSTVYYTVSDGGDC